MPVMPKAGDEFDSFWFDDKSSSNKATMTTWRYRKNGRTVDAVKVVERTVVTAELRFLADPWQAPHWVYHYGDETVWTA